MKRSNARSEDVAASGSTRPPAASRRRRPHRAPLALASLVFLFVFGLGQISTIAGAGELKTEPVATGATETAETDGPAEETVATDDGSSESAESTDDTDPTESTDSSVEGATSSDTDLQTSSDDDVVASGSKTEIEEKDNRTQASTTEADTPGPASGDGVQPVLVPENPSCSTLMGDAFLFEFKQEPVQDATIPLSFTLDDGTVLTGTLVIDVNESAQTVDFTLTGDFVAAGVIVKGGPNANFYDYRPDGSGSDTGLHAPVNPSNGQFYGLSHVSFCLIQGEDGEQPETGIDVSKTCPGTVDAGATIEFTITVENTGTEALTDITVEDSLIGDITAEFDTDLSAGLAAGASATATVTYQPGAGEDPVENTVTATATGVESQTDVSDSATCVTDVLPPPLSGGGENPPPGVGQGPPPAGAASGGTAFTGFDTWFWALLAAMLSVLGIALVIATRKHHA